MIVHNQQRLDELAGSAGQSLRHRLTADSLLELLEAAAFTKLPFARNLVRFGPLCSQLAVILQTSLDFKEVMTQCTHRTRRRLKLRHDFLISHLGFPQLEQKELVLVAPE